MTTRATAGRRAAMAMILAAAALLVAGCEVFGIPIGSPPARPAEAALAGARARWAEAAIDDYQFTIQTICFCQQSVVGPFRVTVVDGVTTDIVNLEGGAVDADTRRAVPLTVDALFAKVAEALDRADSLVVAYDDVFGFPTSIDIDWIVNAIDDETTFEVTDFSAST